MKWADLGHAAKPFPLHDKWTRRITEEFFTLGDKERALGIAISPLCDRTENQGIAKSQLGFFRFICVPLYEAIADLIEPKMVPWIQLNDNLRTWRSKLLFSHTDSSASDSSPPSPHRLQRRASLETRARDRGSPSDYRPAPPILPCESSSPRSTSGPFQRRAGSACNLVAGWASPTKPLSASGLGRPAGIPPPLRAATSLGNPGAILTESPGDISPVLLRPPSVTTPKRLMTDGRWADGPVMFATKP